MKEEGKKGKSKEKEGYGDFLNYEEKKWGV